MIMKTNVAEKKQKTKFNFDRFTKKMAQYELNRIKEVANRYNRGELIISDEDRKKVVVLFQIVCESLGFTAQLKLEKNEKTQNSNTCGDSPVEVENLD